MSAISDRQLGRFIAALEKTASGEEKAETSLPVQTNGDAFKTPPTPGMSEIETPPTSVENLPKPSRTSPDAGLNDLSTGVATSLASASKPSVGTSGAEKADTSLPVNKSALDMFIETEARMNSLLEEVLNPPTSKQASAAPAAPANQQDAAVADFLREVEAAYGPGIKSAMDNTYTSEHAVNAASELLYDASATGVKLAHSLVAYMELMKTANEEEAAMAAAAAAEDPAAGGGAPPMPAGGGDMGGMGGGEDAQSQELLAMIMSLPPEQQEQLLEALMADMGGEEMAGGGEMGGGDMGALPPGLSGGGDETISLSPEDAEAAVSEAMGGEPKTAAEKAAFAEITKKIVNKMIARSKPRGSK